MKSFLQDVIGWLILAVCVILLIWNFMSRWDEQLAKDELTTIVTTETTTAVASFYAHSYHGRTQANGKPYDMHKLTFAHKTLPFGTRVLFQYNGKEVEGVCTDRGPYIAGRMFDLSYAMACSLGMVERGVDAVSFTIIN